MDAMALRYSKLPSEVLELTPADFYLNLCIAFPERIQKRHRSTQRRNAENILGYNPIKKLIAMLRG